MKDGGGDRRQYRGGGIITRTRLEHVGREGQKQCKHQRQRLGPDRSLSEVRNPPPHDLDIPYGLVAVNTHTHTHFLKFYLPFLISNILLFDGVWRCKKSTSKNIRLYIEIATNIEGTYIYIYSQNLGGYCETQKFPHDKYYTLQPSCYNKQMQFYIIYCTTRK